MPVQLIHDILSIMERTIVKLRCYEHERQLEGWKLIPSAIKEILQTPLKNLKIVLQIRQV